MENKTHASYNVRLFINVILVLLLLAAIIFLSGKAIKYNYGKYVKYNESEVIDYRVYLKKNDFYEKDYLDKGMIYVASIIDRIDIDFNYDFDIKEKTNVDFDYNIVGDLVITNKDGKTNYFEKEYTLLDKKTGQIKDSNKYSIKEKISIDYDEYNKIASDFKSSYGVDTNSYLKISLQVDKKNNEDNDIIIDDKTISSINIPLSERSVEIKFDSEDKNVEKKAKVKPKVDINWEMFILEIVLLLILIFAITKLIKLLLLLKKNKSNYDRFIEKILKDYDRLVVETASAIDLKNKNIIKIERFNELLDIRESLKLPIMYYNVVSHQKSYFYIKSDNDIYLMKVKASDMGIDKYEEKKEESNN